MKTSLLVLTLLLGTTLTAQAFDVERERVTTSRAGKSGSGTNVGGTDSNAAFLNTWCQEKSAILIEAKENADRTLEYTGDLNSANKELTEGMIQALTNGSPASSAFFYKSLERGLKISTHLEATRGGNEEKFAQSTYNILNNYYDFMITTVAEDLDLNGRNPFLGSQRDKNRIAKFEEYFVTYAHLQLEWVLENLMRTAKLGDKIQVVPVGNADAVLKVALTLSQGTSEDLKDSLWAQRYSCSIGHLDALNKRLAAYVAGNGAMFPDKKAAITHVYNKLQQVAKSIEVGHCK